METWLLLTIVFSTLIIQTRADEGGGELTVRRQKREWIIPPKKLMENVDYTHQEFIAWIRSDEATQYKIRYSLKGPGADEEPFGLFSVHPESGKVRIHGLLDREKKAFYHLRGTAMYTINAAPAEKDIDLRIIVLDQNDNPPVFSIQTVGYIKELSDIGTYVINITATDADDPTTKNAIVRYKIIQQYQSESYAFYIEQRTGQIFVKVPTLDREERETYKLIITGTDMDGDAGGLTGTGTVIIHLLDVNDNIPVLDKPTYECSVKENTVNVVVIRLNCTDADEIGTENWEAVYTIVSGNEAGYFHITTDPKTNQGVLTIIKEVDYEQLKTLDLKVKISNKAAYHHSVTLSEQNVYSIKVNVQNENEAPHFQPRVKVVTISENSATISLTKVITTYSATDSDTLKTATNVRYLKWEDKDNWLSIDEKTAEIRLIKYPDRESTFLINGIYYAKIICVTGDAVPKTATGTIAIQVEDYNDHCPTLSSSIVHLCYSKRVVYVTATDGDVSPNAEPFKFTVDQTTKEKWNTERMNDSTVLLRSHDDLWPGFYTVALKVEDQQGKSCGLQILQVSVCICTEAEVCRPQRHGQRGVEFGALGILAMILGILLLLLIPLLLLLCGCGAVAANFQDFPFSHKEQLISYNTEGQGDDRLMDATLLPQKIGHQEILGAGKGSTEWESREQWRDAGCESHEEFNKEKWLLSSYDADYMFSRGHGTAGQGQAEVWQIGSYDGMALSDAYLHHYFSKKAVHAVEQEFGRNVCMVYQDEGNISPAGSFEDICAQLDAQDDLDFLEDLGPQFKTLAKICHGSLFHQEETTVRQVPSSSRVEVKSSAGGQRSEVMSSASKMASASTSASTTSATVSAAASSSTTHVATADYAQHASSSSSSAGEVSRTLLVQQPAQTVYLSSAPVYLMEQQRSQPTLLLTAGQVMGVQESNVLLLDQANVTLAQSTMPTLAHTRLMVQPPSSAAGGAMVLGVSEAQATSGSFQSVQPVHIVCGSTSVSESHVEQSRGRSTGKVALPSELTLSRQDKAQITAGSQQTVREERISVVEKSSFLSS